MWNLFFTLFYINILLYTERAALPLLVLAFAAVRVSPFDILHFSEYLFNQNFLIESLISVLQAS